MHKILPAFLVLVLAVFITSCAFLPVRQGTAYWIKNHTDQKINIPADTTTSCTDPKSLTDATGAFDDSAQLAFYNDTGIDYPKTSLEAQNTNDLNSAVLAAYDSAGKEKWIEVNLETQTLTAWNGSEVYMQFPISSGLWYPTPPGTYTIYWKLRYTRMTGGNKAWGTFYDLPNVPDTMYFYQGYGIHGAYWHHNFGHPMSHGCVNEPLVKAHELFEWAGPHINPDQTSIRATADNPGSRVWIH